jgi:hypothetical protein
VEGRKGVKSVCLLVCGCERVWVSEGVCESERVRVWEYESTKCEGV